jgi:hypothetical protein
MIAITNDNTAFPHIENAVVVNKLEKMTGADMLISPLDISASKIGLIREHLNNKAILVQVKLGVDLAASVGERLASSLVRMHEIAPTQAQRVLLFVGTLACDAEGHAIIDGRGVDQYVPGINYWSCQTSLDAWSERGGVVVQLSRVGLLAEWCRRKEQRLKKYLSDPVEFFYPDKPNLLDKTVNNNPLQVPIKVSDWRVPMSYLIGPKKSQLLYDKLGDRGGQAFEAMSSYDFESLPKGIYKGDVDKFRQRMNLGRGEKLKVVTSE